MFYGIHVGLSETEFCFRTDILFQNWRMGGKGEQTGNTRGTNLLYPFYGIHMF